MDERFLEELKHLPQKNLAVELLKKLLKNEIKKRTKINLVESKMFSEMLEDAGVLSAPTQYQIEIQQWNASGHQRYKPLVTHRLRKII